MIVGTIIYWCIYDDTDSDFQSEFNSFFKISLGLITVFRIILYTGFKANPYIFRSFDDVGSCPSKAPSTDSNRETVDH